MHYHYQILHPTVFTGHLNISPPMFLMKTWQLSKCSFCKRPCQSLEELWGKQQPLKLQHKKITEVKNPRVQQKKGKIRKKLVLKSKIPVQSLL